MRSFVFGLLVGVFLTGTAWATAGPRMSGSNGYLTGYTVKIRLGERICRDPYVTLDGDRATGTIECNAR